MRKSKPIIESCVHTEKEKFWLNDNEYYDIEEAMKIAEIYKPFKLPLKHIDIFVKRWTDVEEIWHFAWHMKRALNADLNYPILMDRTGTIINGWHRISKALATDLEYVMCVRIEEDLKIYKKESNEGE